MTVVFLDTNIPMYVAGEDHPLKIPCFRILTLVADHPSSFATDAEVLQEILHRYMALNRRGRAPQAVLEFAFLMEGRVEPVTAPDVVRAAEVAGSYPRLSARDLLHLEVMHRLQISRIISADSAFDGITDVERLDPSLVDVWAGTLGLS